jgi:iron complex outermembrane receptor protein
LFTRAYFAAPAWNQVDLRGTWSGDHDRYEVVLYVKNLFDTLGSGPINLLAGRAIH